MQFAQNSYQHTRIVVPICLFLSCTKSSKYSWTFPREVEFSLSLKPIPFKHGWRRYGTLDLKHVFRLFAGYAVYVGEETSDLIAIKLDGFTWDNTINRTENYCLCGDFRESLQYLLGCTCVPKRWSWRTSLGRKTTYCETWS